MSSHKRPLQLLAGHRDFSSCSKGREESNVQGSWTWSKELQALHKTAKGCKHKYVMAQAQQLSSAMAWDPAKCADLYKVCGVSSEHLFQPQKGGEQSRVCFWCPHCTSSTTQGKKSSPQCGHVLWSHSISFMALSHCWSNQRRQVYECTFPSWLGWCWAQSERSLFGLLATCPTPHEVLQSHISSSVLLLPSIAFPISHRNQMASTWSQNTATSVLSTCKTFSWICFSHRSFSCKVKWKPQCVPYLSDKIRDFAAQHSDILLFLHGKSRNYHHA